MNKQKERQEKILDIAKRRGFFWQTADIYGGVAGFYDYAHLGCALKRKWENLWRDFFIGLNDNFYEIETCVMMPEAVFRASGHLKSFVDPVVKCSKCKTIFRADHIIKSVLKKDYEGFSPEELMKIIKEHNIVCPGCGGRFEEAGVLNMMFPVDVGTGKETRKAYLLPETAQGAYLNFKQEFECLRKKFPLGLAIIGKAFRNEISPRNVLIRMREFTQAELQIFFNPKKINEHPDFESVKEFKLRLFPVANREKNEIMEVSCEDAVNKLGLPKFYVYHMAKIQEFYTKVLGLSKDIFRFKELSEEERAFYNKYHWDIELFLESLDGFKEVAGIHYRTDHDLSGHQKVSGQSMEVNIDGETFVPHVLELSFGVDRNIYALFELALKEEEERIVLVFPRLVSPYDAGVFPLVSKDRLPEKAKEVFRFLKESGFSVFYDETGSIGRRYRRIDEVGVPAGITIDYESLEDETVTIRDRDSMKQIRVSISELPVVLRRFLAGESLGKLGKPVN
ncbi:MAG: glycine--tRNA ligase [Candidatus Aenigmatarchaeota archaeon]|nr:MAG: glycine--tRNA ligase [Candidatus Aenigmarchaeota archaeon]